jgi:hypothetical protein
LILILIFAAEKVGLEEEYSVLEEAEREVKSQCAKDSIYIDETFIEKRTNYKTAKELFGDGNRDAVKLRKTLEDERQKREKLLRFTNHCIHFIKSKKKCKFCCKT